MDAEAERVERRRRAAEELQARVEVDLDDWPVEVVVALEVQQVAPRETTGVEQPLEVVVEEVAAQGLAIHDRDEPRDERRAEYRQRRIDAGRCYGCGPVGVGSGSRRRSLHSS